MRFLEIELNQASLISSSLNSAITHTQTHTPLGIGLRKREIEREKRTQRNKNTNKLTTAYRFIVARSLRSSSRGHLAEEELQTG